MLSIILSPYVVYHVSKLKHEGEKQYFINTYNFHIIHIHIKRDIWAGRRRKHIHILLWSFVLMNIYNMLAVSGMHCHATETNIKTISITAFLTVDTLVVITGPLDN